MDTSIIIQPKEILLSKAQDNALSDFSITSLTQYMADESRSRLIENLGLGSAVLDSITRITNAKQYTVEIPEKLIQLFKEGKVSFDKSGQIPGNLTPNIRDIDGNLVGQATIKEGFNPQAITQSAMNVAMMATLAEISKKLDIMDEKIEAISKGLHNDRLAKIISGLQSFYYSFQTIHDPALLKERAFVSFSLMNEGMNSLHFEIDERRKELDKAPTSTIKAMLVGKSGIKKYRNKYYSLEADMRLYYQFQILLETVAVYAFDSSISQNVHTPFEKMNARIFNKDFLSDMYYLTNKPKNSLLLEKISKSEKILLEREKYIESNPQQITI